MRAPALNRLLPLLALAGWGTLSASTLEDDVLPILSEHCTKCHGAELQMAGLGLHDVASALNGGANGPVVVPAKPDESPLIARIASGSMPPGDEPKLSEAQVRTIRDWVATISPESFEAASTAETTYVSSITDEDRAFWSFRHLSRPAPPSDGESVTPVDAFLLRKLREKGLDFSAPATRAQLIRRATFDLTGLPPTPEEVAAFEQDNSPEAYERVLDRLLASPHFGERWGRHWLDVAGYVDTLGRDVQANGYQVGPGRWRYRDYVVTAFNSDKPFDRFVQEQLAGDELVPWRDVERFEPETVEALTATGYLRTVEDPTNSIERNTELLRYSVLHQTIEILTSGITGLTVGCARCHTHKFDPIPQRDYYRLMAVLATAYNPDDWVQPQNRFLADVPPPERAEIDRHNEALEKQIEPLAEEQKELIERGTAAHIAARVAPFPEAEHAAIEKAARTPAKRRSLEQKALAQKAMLETIDSSVALAALSEEERSFHAELGRRIEQLESKKRRYNKLEALYNHGPTPVIRLHRRGDHESLGEVTPPGGIEVLEDEGETFFDEAASSGRRLALAKWLTTPDTRAAALVARVMVNRTWAQLFGEGIVTTLDNFGKMGARPTHPELLEWLASEFQHNGWRVKPLIRSLMLTEAYRQSSSSGPAGEALSGADPNKVDPGNSLLWRMRTRRLESEVIRDSMLAISGKLNPKFGGPPVATRVQSDGMVVLDEDRLQSTEDRYRRSLYLVARRRFNLSMLGVFDHPVMSTNATQRHASAVVLQSLMMLNDAEVNEQATFFAERVAAEAGDDVEAQIALAFQMALGRSPAADEVEWASAFYGRELERYRAAAPGSSPAAAATPSLAALGGLCHVLFNSNEFLYVE